MKTENTYILYYRKCKNSVILLALFMMLTGILYPLIVTGIAQILFHSAANGKPLIKNQKAIGFELIGQSFSSPKYFWSRPSATTPFPNNATASNGSNLGPTNPALLSNLKSRIEALQNAHGQTTRIPIELVTTSGSGLDPHISPFAAMYQVERIAKNRQIPEEKVKDLIFQSIEKRQLSFLGEPRVNVLKLNLALDTLAEQPIPTETPVVPAKQSSILSPRSLEKSTKNKNPVEIKKANKPALKPQSKNIAKKMTKGN